MILGFNPYSKHQYMERIPCQGKKNESHQCKKKEKKNNNMKLVLILESLMIQGSSFSKETMSWKVIGGFPLYGKYPYSPFLPLVITGPEYHLGQRLDSDCILVWHYCKALMKMERQCNCSHFWYKFSIQFLKYKSHAGCFTSNILYEAM